jgi:hypothetical protein
LSGREIEMFRAKRCETAKLSTQAPYAETAAIAGIILAK